jgi:serine/threonine-protein kinase
VADSLLPGAVIADRYVLLRLIGEGGMSSVWAATHALTRKAVALKFLKPELAKKSELRQRFLREARAASAVRHPNIVQIHDVLELDDRSPVMVMDLLEGESLASRVARDGPLPLVEVARLLLPVVSAIQSAHALGIVHRDLKPENLFLVSGAPGEPHVRVLDFGIAKLTGVEGDAAQSAELTRTGSMLGTIYYMSPEQTYGERDVDHRADIWALGVILYECLTGRRPTEGENVGQILKSITTGSFLPLARVAPGLPADVTELVARMLALDRNGRPQDLREVATVLERHASDVAQSRGLALAEHPGRAPGRRTGRTGIAAMAGGAMVGLSIWFFASAPRHEHVSEPDAGAAAAVAPMSPPGSLRPLASIEDVPLLLATRASAQPSAFAPAAEAAAPPVRTLEPEGREFGPKREPVRTLEPEGREFGPKREPVAPLARSARARTLEGDAETPKPAASPAATGSARPPENPEKGPGGLVVRPGF